MVCRSGKFYRKNEADVMKSLGLEPTKNSGAGWVEKEDGYNDAILCQLKSTDADSIRVHLLDLKKLEYNADVAYKLPVFAVQFLTHDELWLMVRPDDLQAVADGMAKNKSEGKEKKYAKGIANIDNKYNNDDNGFNGWEPPSTVGHGGNERLKFDNEIKEKFQKKERRAL